MNKWEILNGNEPQKCLDCGHESTQHAENNDYVVNEQTGERDVFCPECHSAFYYIK